MQPQHLQQILTERQKGHHHGHQARLALKGSLLRNQFGYEGSRSPVFDRGRIKKLDGIQLPFRTIDPGS